MPHEIRRHRPSAVRITDPDELRYLRDCGKSARSKYRSLRISFFRLDTPKRFRFNRYSSTPAPQPIKKFSYPANPRHAVRISKEEMVAILGD